MSGLCFCAPAFAQDREALSADIKERIESTFGLVLGNSAELAVPLTRRALARRSIEDDDSDDYTVDPLAYRDPQSANDGPEHTAAIGPVAEGAPADDASDDASADEEDLDVARLPRPRPAPTSAQVTEAMGGPLDLVAGAAVEVETPVVVASADPQPLLVAHPAPPVEGEAAPAAKDDEVVQVLPGPIAANGPCMPLKDVTDKDDDFTRNASVLSGSAFCIAEANFTERRHKWTIETIRTNRPGPLWAVMHDDEDMSFDTAVGALQAYGGTLVAVETGGKRNMDGIDPNRNFSADGVGCKKLGNDATPDYTGFFRKLLDPVQPIIALHNNTGEKIPTGGLGHVSMDDVPKDMEAHASVDKDGTLAGDRALVLLTSTDPVTSTAEARAVDLSAKGVNALIETVRDGKGDCSLSNYTLLTGHPDYLNITVDDDERDKQRKIIDVIMRGHANEVATQ